MDVFAVRNRLIDDYSEYVRSFIQIRDFRIEAEVHGALDSGLLWPDPLIQLNPAFEPGDSIDELVTAGVLHGNVDAYSARTNSPVATTQEIRCAYTSTSPTRSDAPPPDTITF